MIELARPDTRTELQFGASRIQQDLVKKNLDIPVSPAVYNFFLAP